MSTWADYADRLTLQARKASRQMAIVSGEQKQRWLHRSAELLMQHVEEIVAGLYSATVVVEQLFF